MGHIVCKDSVLWMNIGEVAIQNGKITRSVYKCAHFYHNYPVSPQNPIF